jgi:glutathione S-transferase
VGDLAVVDAALRDFRRLAGMFRRGGTQEQYEQSQEALAALERVKQRLARLEEVAADAQELAGGCRSTG